MSEEDKKPRFHIHWFRLVIIIVIIFVLLNVDLRSLSKSPQLQNNISYAKNEVIILWNKYLAEPINNFLNNLLRNLVNQGIDKAKDTVDIKLDNLKQ
jgi:hypothetical protein